MPIPSFSISEVRVAATCPRITYFDAEHTRRDALKARSVTRIWKAGDAVSACGALFHHAIESFNRRALEAPEVRAALEGPPDPRAVERRLREYLNRTCVNLDALIQKPPAQQAAFIQAVGIYMRELADIVGDALARGKSAGEVLDHLFGDRRRRVDVTFAVGPAGEPVHVTGILDYVFYDWRTANHRILDYKLTPSDAPNHDLFQVGLYALMHNVQHRTEPDVGVLYLHPERRMVTLTWADLVGQRPKLYNLLASMAEWVRYDEQHQAGLKPPGEPSYCPHCRWDRGGPCLDRLGPKHQGTRLAHWPAAAAAAGPAGGGPRIEARAVSLPSRAWAAEVEPSAEDVQVVAIPSEPAAASSRPAPGPGPAPAGPPIPPPGEDVLRIGATTDGDAPVGLPTAALPTHVAVVGAAGSGKTWMAKVIAEEAVRRGIPVLAIDPQGDLVQFLRPGPEPAGLSAGDRALRRAFLDRVEPRVWTPGSSHGRRLCLDPVRLAGRDELERIADPMRREEEWEGMLEVAAGQLVGLAKAGGEEDSQRTFLLQVLRCLARAGGDVGLGRVAAAVADPGAAGLDDPDRFVKKAERERLARKLNGLLHGPSARLYGGGRRLDLDDLRRAEAPGKTPLNVIYLNALADDDQKHFFVAALAAEVYRWMVTSLDATGRPQLLLYLDEARDFLPAGASKPPAKPPLLRLFAQGRKYGVACLICTQSPRSVDYNAFSNCSTKLVGRLESAQDAERVAEWFGTAGGTPPWLGGRKGAAAGSFVGRWPGMPPGLEGRAFRSRPLWSLHEGAWSPDRLERETAGGEGPRT